MQFTNKHFLSRNILPPANGKKLWRVKRTPSMSSTSSKSSTSSSTSSSNNSNTTQSETSLECLNNSLRIAAAAQGGLTIRRPPLRRPKNKPGKPKSFVFVDLSPIKSDEEAEIVESTKKVEAKKEEQEQVSFSGAHQLPSPTSSLEDSLSIDDSLFDLPTLNYEMESNTSVSTSPDMELGLGIMNLGIDWNQPQSFQQQEQQQEQQAPAPVPAPAPLPQQQDYLSQQLYGYQQAMMHQHLQIQQLQQQLLQQQQQQQQQMQVPILHSTPQLQSLPQLPSTNDLQSPFQSPIKKKKRATSSSSSSSSSSIQFKTYKPKHTRTVSEACIKKPTSLHKKQVPPPHSRSKSLPYATPVTTAQAYVPEFKPMEMQQTESSVSDVMNDFMMLNEMSMSLTNSVNSTNTYAEAQLTPASSYCEEVEEFTKPSFPSVELSCGFEEFLAPIVPASAMPMPMPMQNQNQSQNQTVLPQQLKMGLGLTGFAGFNEFELGTFVQI